MLLVPVPRRFYAFERGLIGLRVLPLRSLCPWESVSGLSAKLRQKDLTANFANTPLRRANGLQPSPRLLSIGVLPSHRRPGGTPIERPVAHARLGAEGLAERLRVFGSLFIGENTAEVFGDYGSGTNHILPTGGAARFTGGVFVGTFLKTLTWQRILPQGQRQQALQAAALADAEGLVAHAAAARARLQ